MNAFSRNDRANAPILTRDEVASVLSRYPAVSATETRAILAFLRNGRHLDVGILTADRELKPQLERRGYEVVVFHTTGMGGRAMESIAAQGGFAAVLDLSLQEVANQLTGSVVNSGADRLENAGRAGIPQIVAPGAIDMVDFPAWLGVPNELSDRPFHAHNRLLASATSGSTDRQRIARAIAGKLSQANAPVAFVLPAGGIQQWDREGEALHDPDALAAFVDAMRSAIEAPVELHEIKDHINSAAFNETVLGIFDRWVAAGIVPRGRTTAAA